MPWHLLCFKNLNSKMQQNANLWNVGGNFWGKLIATHCLFKLARLLYFPFQFLLNVPSNFENETVLTLYFASICTVFTCNSYLRLLFYYMPVFSTSFSFCLTKLFCKPGEIPRLLLDLFSKHIFFVPHA